MNTVPATVVFFDPTAERTNQMVFGLGIWARDKKICWNFFM